MQNEQDIDNLRVMFNTQKIVNMDYSDRLKEFNKILSMIND